MKRKFSLLLILILIYGCQNQLNPKKSIEDYIPTKAQLVLRINSMDVFKSALKNNVLLSKTKLQSILESNLGPVDSLKISGPLLVCINSNNETPSYTFIAEQKHVDTKSLLIPKYIQDSIWVFPSSPLKSKESFLEHPFKKLSSILDENATFSIYTAKTKQHEFLLFENVLLDVNATPESIAINGMYTDSNSDWVKMFDQITPKAQQLDKIAPSDAQNFKSFVFSDFEQFSKNLKAIDSTLTFSEFSKSLMGTIQEIGSLNTTNGTAIALHSLDMRATRDALIGFQEELNTFRSIPIFKFNNDTVFQQSFGVLLPKMNTSTYTVLDDFLVFSDQQDVLEEIISKYSNKNNLNTSEAFLNTTQKLSDELSFQNTLSSDDLARSLNSLLGTSLSASDLDDYQNSVIQVIKDDAVVHINAQIENFRPTQQQNNVSEVFSLTLDAPILGNVQFLENHRTQEKDIAVQDIENNLYLISNQGVIRCKKKLSGAILGRINQVDLFNNGRLQIVFSTPNKVYVLDRLGRDVGTFPLNFKDKITQAISVFDYDKNKNYRFLVTQNKSLLMYDSNGKQVKGFKHKSNATVNTSPQHIRYNGKDYIVFAAGKKLKILNRRGQDRIRVKESINFSDQDIFFYNNKFTTLDTQGDLVQVDMKGRVSRQTLGFDAQTQITTSSRTLVAQWTNKLQIKDKKNTLDFGSYLSPQLFYLNDKIYIALTDQQAQKITLFDSNGSVFPGFPVYGISKIDLSNADKDSALEFICQSSASELIMYQIY